MSRRIIHRKESLKKNLASCKTCLLIMNFTLLLQAQICKHRIYTTVKVVKESMYSISGGRPCHSVTHGPLKLHWLTNLLDRAHFSSSMEETAPEPHRANGPETC